MPTAKKSNNTLVIFASPHKNSSTHKLMSMVCGEVGVQPSEIINIYDCSIKPCIDCRACVSNECVFNQTDDMGMILEKIQNHDVIIFAAPVYFNSVPAPLKAFIDRLEQFFVRYINQGVSITKNKRGFLAVTMGSGDKHALDCVNSIFKQVFTCIGAEFSGFYYADNLDKKDVSVSVY